jgi:hypothetical protein
MEGLDVNQTLGGICIPRLIWLYSIRSNNTKSTTQEHLSLETDSSQVLEFVGKARATNWRTFQMLPSWISSWCYQQMLD